MTLNPYFRYMPREERVDNEYHLLDDLIEESIEIMGHECYFIPRESFDEGDLIYGEYSKSKYEDAYLINCYMTDIKEFQGEKDFFSKFGLEIRESSNLILSRKTFKKMIPTEVRHFPREGDLLYLPVFRRMFEIKFIEEESEHFALGKKLPYTYNMRCELFRYTHEPITTGNECIDEVMMENTYTLRLQLVSGSGDYNKGEIVYQGSNLAYSTATALVKEWDSVNTNIYIVNIVGEFLAGNTITGNTTNTVYTIFDYNKMEDHCEYDLIDNLSLYEQGNNSVILTERNPFGIP